LNQTATLEIGPHFAAYASFQLEPITDVRPGERRAIRAEGLYAEELFAQWTDDALTLQAGKFIPTFGRAWYLTPAASTPGSSPTMRSSSKPASKSATP
jgi:hypothetical protein